jgi:hypothetical protein
MSSTSSPLIPISFNLHQHPKRDYGKWRPNILTLARLSGLDSWPLHGLLHLVATDDEWALLVPLVIRPPPLVVPPLPPLGATADEVSRYKLLRHIYDEQHRLSTAFQSQFNDSLGPTILKAYRDPIFKIFLLNPKQASDQIFLDFGRMDDADIHHTQSSLSNPLAGTDRNSVIQHFSEFDENLASLQRSAIVIAAYTQYTLFRGTVSSFPGITDIVRQFEIINYDMTLRTYDALKVFLIARINDFGRPNFVNAATASPPPNNKRSFSRISSPAATRPSSRPSSSCPVVPRTPDDTCYCWVHGYAKKTTRGSHFGRSCPVMLASPDLYPKKFLHSTKHSYGTPGEVGNSHTY